MTSVEKEMYRRLPTSAVPSAPSTSSTGPLSAVVVPVVVKSSPVLIISEQVPPPSPLSPVENEVEKSTARFSFCNVNKKNTCGINKNCRESDNKIVALDNIDVEAVDAVGNVEGGDEASDEEASDKEEDGVLDTAKNRGFVSQLCVSADHIVEALGNNSAAFFKLDSKKFIDALKANNLLRGQLCNLPSGILTL